MDLYLPSYSYYIKVEQVNGVHWSSTGHSSLRSIKRFLKRKRKQYGDIRIVSFKREEGSTMNLYS